MTLIEKKLQQLQPGTKVDLMLKDESCTHYIGTVVDNDFESCIEVVNESGSTLLMYELVGFVTILTNTAPVTNNGYSDARKGSYAHGSFTATPKTVGAAINPIKKVDTFSQNVSINPREYGLRFLVSVAYPHFSDFELDNYFKTKLQKDEKKTINKYYQSFKVQMKNTDVNRARECVSRLVDEMRAGGYFSYEAWAFAVYLQIRSIKKPEYELLEKNKMYDHLAVYYQTTQKNNNCAIACACASIVLGLDNVSREVLYTIIANCCFEEKNFACLATLAGRIQGILFDENFVDLLKYVYFINGSTYRAGLKTSEIEAFIKDKYGNQHPSMTFLSLYIAGGTMKSRTCENEKNKSNFGVVGETNSSPSNGAYKEKTIGRIVHLSWSSERGKIETEDKELVDFSYSDISDEKLYEKIKGLMCSNLEKSGYTFDVEFVLSEAKATAIVETKDRTFVGTKAKAIVETKATEFVETEIQAVDSALPEESNQFESSLKRGRRIIAASKNEERFEEALVWFKAAVEEESDISLPIAECVNCYLAIANKTGDSSYLDAAYELYSANKDKFSVPDGIARNVALLDLCIKLKKRDEVLFFVNKILADPKIPVETRLNYILQKANALFDNAQSIDDEDHSQEEIFEAYSKAKTAYMDWEQRYLERSDVMYSQNHKKIYYTIVLVGIARCHKHLGEVAESHDLLRRIIHFDPSNDVAKKLYKSAVGSNAASVDVSVEEDTEELFDFVDVEPEDDFFDESQEYLHVYEYKDVAGWDELGFSEDDIYSYVFKLSGSNAIPVALTYLKAAAKLNEGLADLYNIFSYATNNPMEKPDYSLTNVVQQFNECNHEYSKFEYFAKAAALLRGTFYHTADNDYFTAAAYIDDIVCEMLPSFKSLVENVDLFRSQTGKGADAYADYKTKSSDSKEEQLAKVNEEAKKIFELYFNRYFHETVAQKRFKVTKALVFAKDGILRKLVSCVMDNDTDVYAEIKEELTKTFIRQGAVISVTNIDISKVESFIDSMWVQAGKAKALHARVGSDLMGSLRNNLRTPIKHILELFCEWVNLSDSLNDASRSNDLAIYRAHREDIIGALLAAEEDCSSCANADDEQVLMGINVIKLTINEILDKIEGSWSDKREKFFFADFLRTDNVLLDDDYFPDISSSFCNLDEFNILARIRKHEEASDADILEYAKSIFTRDETKHNFGTAAKILEYLSFCGHDVHDLYPDNIEELEKLAEKKMRGCYDQFNLNMCTATSRGQISISDSFLISIDDTVQYWYQNCLETKEYGFFYSLIICCEKTIREGASAYGVTLTRQLERLAEEHSLDEDDKDKIMQYIDTMFFTVAEEIISRITKGDVVSESETMPNAIEYLNLFWEEFDRNYNLMANGSGSSLVRLVSTNVASKDKRGGENLINSWPRSNRVNCEQIKSLVKYLGWGDTLVEENKIPNVTHPAYKITQSNKLFTLREYAHPIAAFGTQSVDNGFYVVCYFGYADSGRLLDLCRKLDSVIGNVLILIDYALSATDRRKLAKVMKQTSFKNTYLFVDRVGVFFVANHYVGGGGDVNNRTLLAISMPFTYYQPYTLGSTVSTAPELFAGRRDELLSVESSGGANLIYGGRQLGKTAILRKAANETHDPEKGRYAFVIDIRNKGCAQTALSVSRYLNTEAIFSEDEVTDDWDKFEINLRKSIREKKISYLLLMLDEADAFVDDCKNYNYAPFVVLKSLQQGLNGKFKFVLAGLHNLVKFKREVSLGNNSVIPHLSYINVKPFDYLTAKCLLSDPLAYLGFDFGKGEESDALFMQIFSATNYYPGLIQMFCNKLIESMKVNYGGYEESKAPSYKVTNQHISKVLADKDFLAEIKEKFEITLRLGQDNYYYIIALLLAMLLLDDEVAEGYSLQDIKTMAGELGVDVFKVIPNGVLDASLEELCDLNILRFTGAGYTFRTKSFRDLLGSKEQIFDELVNILGAS